MPSALTACFTDRAAVLFYPFYGGTNAFVRDLSGVFVVEHFTLSRWKTALTLFRLGYLSEETLAP
jgi:hypothetical protein